MATALKFRPARYTRLSHVRADTLPENVSYKDDGCDVSPSCLNCPLPICKYDDPGWLQRASRRGRDEAVIRARSEEKLPVSEIAERFNVSTRTVHRILKGHREAPAGPRKAGAPEPDQPPLISVLALQRRSFFREPAPLPPIWPPATPHADDRPLRKTA